MEFKLINQIAIIFFIHKKGEPFGSPSLVNKYNYLPTANLTHS